MTKSDKTATDTSPMSEFMTMMKDAQGTGMQNMPGFGMEWVNLMTKMGSEMLSFTAERLQKDMETQQALLNARDIAEVQRVQAEFFKKAMEDYSAETVKLLEMSRDLSPKGSKTDHTPV